MRGSHLNTLGIILLLLLVMMDAGYAQIGGKDSFQFLNTPVNARAAALGGYNVSQNRGDLNWVFYNPALLDSVAAGDISISYVNFYGGSIYSQVAYAFDTKAVGKAAVGLTHLSHGNFDSYDEAGNYLGTFNASEYAVRVSLSHRMGPFLMGVAPQLAVSSIAGFRSSALMADIGGVFQHPHKQLSVGLVIKNAGFALGKYAEEKTRLPFDVQLGMSFKPEQMPVIFSFTGTNLPKQNLVYFEPDSRVNFNEAAPGTFTKIFTRVNIGTEFLFGPNFHVLAGYNHRIRRELKLEQAGGSPGFSVGVWIKIKSFELTVARSHYHVVGGNTHFTVSHNVNRLFHKRKSAS
ncbi:MAG: type IX secretion system protein PorQ [Imperialibacter sp.]|uniref:type IX secretion system protein PorQ n=1 Tax=Imperialibacter sp. TaxID=2038411 RepID=UPI0032EDB1AD